MRGDVTMEKRARRSQPVIWQMHIGPLGVNRDVDPLGRRYQRIARAFGGDIR